MGRPAGTSLHDASGGSACQGQQTGPGPAKDAAGITASQGQLTGSKEKVPPLSHGVKPWPVKPQTSSLDFSARCGKFGMWTQKMNSTFPFPHAVTGNYALPVIRPSSGPSLTNCLPCWFQNLCADCGAGNPTRSQSDGGLSTHHSVTSFIPPGLAAQGKRPIHHNSLTQSILTSRFGTVQIAILGDDHLGRLLSAPAWSWLLAKKAARRMDSKNVQTFGKNRTEAFLTPHPPRGQCGQ